MLSRVIPKNERPDHTQAFDQLMEKPKFVIAKEHVSAHDHVRWVYSTCGLDDTVRFIFYRLHAAHDRLSWSEREYLNRLKRKAVLIAQQDIQRKLFVEDYCQLWENLLSEQSRQDNQQLLVERSKLERSFAMNSVADALEQPMRSVDPVGVTVRPLSAPLMRNEADLLEEPITSIVEPAPEPEGTGHSRRPRGECGQVLSGRIDAVVQEIQGPPIEDESDWPDDEPLGLDQLITEIRGAAVEIPLPVEITASEDPPQPLGAGIGTDATAAGVGGNDSSFPNESMPSATVWDAFSGRPVCSNDTTDFLQQLDDEPRLRSAAMLRTLGRVREELEALPEQSALDAPVCISLSDALVLMTQLMSRLR